MKCNETIHDNELLSSKQRLCVIIGVLLLALYLYLPGIVFTPFYSRGEPREALIAQAMYEQSDWVLPIRYQPSEYARKPPLLHWMMLVDIYLFGDNQEWAFRFPSVLLSIFVLLYLSVFLLRRYTLIQSMMSVSILLVLPLWYRCSMLARVDMCLAAASFIALMVFYEKTIAEKSSWTHTAIIILALSAGTLSKGPVAIVIPLGIFLAFLYYKRSFSLRALASLALIASIAAAVSLIWYYLAYMHRGEAFLDIVLSENVGRFLGTMRDNHPPHTHGLWYYPATLIVGCLPFSFLPLLYLTQYKRMLHIGRSYYDSLKQDDFLVYCVFIVLAHLLFYSVPQSKRAEYLLAAYPALAVLIASFLYSLHAQFHCSFKRGLSFVYRLSFILSAVILSLTAGYVLAVRLALIPDIGVFPSVWYLHCWFLCSVLLSIFYYWRWSPNTWNAVVMSFLCLMSILSSVLFPVVGHALTPKEFALSIEKHVANDVPLYSDTRFYALDFYLHGRLLLKKIHEIDGPAYLVSSGEYCTQEVLETPEGMLLEVIVRSNHSVRKPGMTLCLLNVSRKPVLLNEVVQE